MRSIHEGIQKTKETITTSWRLYDSAQHAVGGHGLDTSDITVTYDLQNLINSSMSNSEPLDQTGTNSVEAFLKYLQATYKHLAAVTLPFDL